MEAKRARPLSDKQKDLLRKTTRGSALRTPADALEANLEAQRAYPDKMKELQRRHEAERRRQEAEMEGLRREEADLKRREAELRRRASLTPVAFGDLPEPALRAILLGLGGAPVPSHAARSSTTTR